MHQIVNLISFLVLTSNAVENLPTTKSKELPQFHNLIDVTSHCTLISIRSYQHSTCEISHIESFCNKFIQTVQQQYGSPLVSFLAVSINSLYDINLRTLPFQKRQYINCSIWIQYDFTQIPVKFTRFKPATIIFLSKLETMTYELDLQAFGTKIDWLYFLDFRIQWFLFMQTLNQRISQFCVFIVVL